MFRQKWTIRGFFAVVAGTLLLLALFAAGTRAEGPPPPRMDRYVELQTTKGTIIIRVAYSIVPYTAGNFLDLVNKGFYNGLTFHRVESWVVQGGDPNGNGSGNYVDPQTGRPRFLRLETNPMLNHNHAGMVAMARSSDPNSASCQFYILKSPTPQLNGKYAVFGKVVRGMDSVNQMRIGDRIISARILPLPGQEQQAQRQLPADEPDSSGNRGSDQRPAPGAFQPNDAGF